jgi:hypothetical protein
MRKLFLKLSLEWLMENHMKDSTKIPHIYIQVSITHHWNYMSNVMNEFG